MTGRAPLLVAVVLGVMLALGGVVAWSAGGRSTTAPPPGGAPMVVPATGAGSDLVELSLDAAAHPHAGAVQAQLQRHYRAINGRDHAAWRDTVVAERSDPLPEPAWQDEYASTTDGTIRVDRIDDAEAGGLLVRVRFVSTQAVADAPPDLPAERLCWTSSLPMSAPAPTSPPRIGPTGPGSSRAAVC